VYDCAELQTGCDVLMAAPGRLLDGMMTLDLTVFPLLSHLIVVPRQTLVFSATLEKSVTMITRDFLAMNTIFK
jgi:superfamily II DNA/RNA helicase